MTDTASDETSDRHAEPRPDVAVLYRVFVADAPGRSAIHLLDDVDRVEIARGDAFACVRDGATLRIAIADRRASEHHATLERSLGRWLLHDRGSKNGTLIDGRLVDGAAYLTAGDLIEIGRTFFLFDKAPRDHARAEPLPGVPTLSPAFARQLAQLAILARGATSLVIRGPTGSGKEVIARAVHAASARSGPFVAVNCGAIPRELVESTLFGHRRGAFSGALDDQPGLVRSAHQGTLFLDEIGDLPLPAQAALLRVLQEHEVMPIGGTRSIAVDLRVIAATHRDLQAMAGAGTFRADLLHRLAGYTVELPTLVDRRVDRGELAVAILHPTARSFHPRVVRALFMYPWPGNIRELELVLRAAAELATSGTIEPEHLPERVRAHGDAASRADDDRERVVALLREHRGNVRAIARATGKDPVQVRRWLRRYNLDADEYR